jgi:hypothetical protein
MALKKKWHILMTHTNGENLLNVSLSKPLGIFLFCLLGLLFIGMLASTAFLVRYRVHFPQIEQLQAENQSLRNELDRLVTEIDSIMFRMKQMEEWEDHLRTERNIGMIDRGLRQMGTGGLPRIKVEDPSLDRDLSLRLNELWYHVDDLKNVSSFAYQIRKDLFDNLLLQEEMYSYTPSIYPTFGRISTPYGWRTHPITHKRDFHSGLDIANRIGSPIYATADGVIKEIGYNRYYGRYLIITHKFGYETMYAHLHKTEIRKGDVVEKGQIIATMGSTGRSTGSHLHYEVRRYSRTLNPYHYLNKLEEDIVITQQ